MRASALALACGVLAMGCNRQQAADPIDLSAVPAEGMTVTGQLQSGDNVLSEDDSYYDLYPLDVQAGDTCTITMQSSQFDTYLLLFNESGSVVSQNDDAPGMGLNSQIIYTFPSAGRYEIYANSYTGGMSGSYTLRIQRGTGAGPVGPANGGGGIPTQEPGGPAPAPTELDPSGSTSINGTLGPGDLVLSEDNSFYDIHPIDVQAGDTYTITMQSNQFDTYLILLDPVGSSLQQNDDAPGMGLNSQIIYTFPSAGRYQIMANSYTGGMSGAYTLQIQRHGGGAVAAAAPNVGAGDAADLAAAQEVEPGQSVAGDMSQSTGFGERGPYVLYRLDATEGETYTVRMQGDFDTYLIVQDPNGVEVSRNDDADGLNSALQFTANQNGSYRILATSFASVGSGRFNVSVQRIGPPASEPEPEPTIVEAPPRDPKPDDEPTPAADEPMQSPRDVAADFVALLEQGDTDALAELIADDAQGAAEQLREGELDPEELQRMQIEFSGAQVVSVRPAASGQWLVVVRPVEGSPQRIYVVEQDRQLRIGRIGRR